MSFLPCQNTERFELLMTFVAAAEIFPADEQNSDLLCSELIISHLY